MTENERYLEMPWSIEDTIENLTILKENFARILSKLNFEGLGESDVKEAEFDFDRAIQALKKVQKFEAIGTVEEFKALKEKNVAKKPIALDQWGEYWKCPACGKYAVNDLGCKYKYCPNCGTEFDWQ